MVFRCTWRSCVVVCLLLYTWTFSICALVWAVLMHVRLDNLTVNSSGDPEKEFFDECMRDYTDADDQRYQDRQRHCVGQIAEESRLHWLPKIRTTVDDRVCDPGDLCEAGDPGRCDGEDGDVIACYDLFDAANAETTQPLKGDLLEQAEQECLSPGRWNAYSNSVDLFYCMWKASNYGVCTNLWRTNCPTDTSCCPVAQNYLGTDADPSLLREDLYMCAKSPLVGLFCQLRESDNGTGCTAVTCGADFEWCRDFADIPGQCLSDACQDHERAVSFGIACVAFASLSLFLDAVDVVFLFRWKSAVVPKAGVDFTAACMKIFAHLLCLAGGVYDLTNEVVQRECFNQDGLDMAKKARAACWYFLYSTLLTCFGSLLLAPWSSYWGGHLVNFPETYHSLQDW